MDQFPDLSVEKPSPFLAFPLASLELTSGDLVQQFGEDISLGLNDEGVYTVYFESDPFIQDKNDLIPVSGFDFPIPIVDSVTTLPVPELAELSIDSAVLKGNQLIFTLNSAETSDIPVQISLPQFSREGKILEVDYVIPFDGATPSTLVTLPIDLEGYSVDFSGNNLRLLYDARNAKGERIVLPLSFARITGFEFSYLEGVVFQSTLPTGLQRVDIDIQDSLIEGSYRFQDPKIHFDLTNSFGIPLGIQVKEVYILGADLIPQRLLSPLFDQVIPLEYPQPGDPGRLVQERITFDRHNSNLLDLTHDNIVAIDYDIDIILNPENVSDERFFILDSSQIIVRAEIELSFDALIEGVGLKKTVDVDFGRLDSVQYLRLKVLVDNGLPLSFDPVLSALDSVSGAGVQFAEESGIGIGAAETNETGDVISNNFSELYYLLDAIQLQKVKQMNQLQAEFTLSSPNQGNLVTKIKPGQVLKMRIGAEVNFN